MKSRPYIVMLAACRLPVHEAYFGAEELPDPAHINVEFLPGATQQYELLRKAG